MAVATTIAQHLRALMEVRVVENDPDADTTCIVDLAQPQAGGAGTPTAGCLPLAHFRRFMAVYMTTVGTGGITVFDIIAATDAAGTGAVAVVSHAIGSNPNAIGDTLFLECTAEQIHETLATATHVGVHINLVTSTDEGVVTFVRADPFYPRAGLTADYVS